jgi:hypothetical protein
MEACLGGFDEKILLLGSMDEKKEHKENEQGRRGTLCEVWKCYCMDDASRVGVELDRTS